MSKKADFQTLLHEEPGGIVAAKTERPIRKLRQRMYNFAVMHKNHPLGTETNSFIKSSNVKC